jgi:putative SOS response-associated peptidase YedK
MGGVHDRMPVILSPDTWSNWLSSTALSDSLRRSLLTPSPDGTLSRWPVGRGVGSIRNDYPSLIDPVEPPAIPQELF